MILTIEMHEADIRRVLADYIKTNYGLDIKPGDIPIQVKSKQNFRSEWEEADIRVTSVVLDPTR